MTSETNVTVFQLLRSKIQLKLNHLTAITSTVQFLIRSLLVDMIIYDGIALVIHNPSYKNATRECFMGHRRIVSELLKYCGVPACTGLLLGTLSPNPLDARFFPYH